MVVTMVEARISTDRETDLVEAYGGGTEGTLPPEIVQTFLLHAEGDDLTARCGRRPGAEQRRIWRGERDR